MPRLPFCTHRFTLGGLNLERFINTMQREEIPLLQVRRKDRKTLACECYSCDVGRIASLAQEKGWRMQALQPKGLSALGRFLCQRPGIPLGLILAAVLVMTLSQFVWRVEVHDAGAYRADIAAYLSQMGCGPGTPRASVDAQALERALTYRYPELAWFHVYVSNVTLVVDVVTGTGMPAPPSQVPGHIVASRDGVVDSIRVYAGTAAVQAGDAVKKGQILIRGEERGADGATVYVHAEGTVMARCWHSASVSLPLLDVISQETGRETLQTRIRTPWRCFPQEWETPAYLASNLYIRETPVVGCFFPVVWQEILHREVALAYSRRNAEEVRMEAKDAAEKQLKTMLQGYDIIDKWVDYCMIEDESLSATATAEWLMDIGEESP